MSNEDDTKVLREMITEDVEDGDFEIRKIQKLGRVDVPDEFWDFIDLEIGEEVIVKVEQSEIRIMTKDLSNISTGPGQ